MKLDESPTIIKHIFNLIDQSQTTSEKQQSFMAFILCKIFVEDPFSIIKKGEKYWIMN